MCYPVKENFSSHTRLAMESVCRAKEVHLGNERGVGEQNDGGPGS